MKDRKGRTKLSESLTPLWSDREFSGDGYEDPPVPISNTVVKLINAESTWLETAWEDRKPLID